MNLMNLKKIFNYILINVPQEKIQMNLYRLYENRNNHECKSVGCIIGHSIILDKWENIPKCGNDEINFKLWSEQFTGLNTDSNQWEWCFGGKWSDNKEQILLRIKYLIDNQKTPKEWSGYYYVLPVIKLEPYEFN